MRRGRKPDERQCESAYKIQSDFESPSSKKICIEGLFRIDNRGIICYSFEVPTTICCGLIDKNITIYGVKYG